MDCIVICKRDSKVDKVKVEGFSNDPAKDLAQYARSELERMLHLDKGAPVMIRVK